MNDLAKKIIKYLVYTMALIGAFLALSQFQGCSNRINVKKSKKLEQVLIEKDLVLFAGFLDCRNGDLQAAKNNMNQGGCQWLIPLVTDEIRKYQKNKYKKKKPE